MIDIYNDSSINIIYPEEIYYNRPYCVFGVLKNEEGLKIKEEILAWLSPMYNVYIIEQDSPGKYFEYPALKFFYDLIINNELDYCLYIHTKGSVNTKPFANCVRKFWEDEFTNHLDWYKEQLLTDTPIVALPATGKFKTTWLNGFYCNYEGAKKTVIKENFSNRYYYETIYKLNKNVNIIGRLRNDVDDKTTTTSDSGKKAYIRYINVNYGGEVKRNKRVIYTCITGGYDNLLEIKNYDPDNFDYVCFTDNSTTNSHGQWEIRSIPEDLLTLSNVRQQRNIKICPHKYLSEYDLSIWIDGSVEVRGNVMSLLSKVLEDDISIYIPKHPVRNCIYKEADAVLKINKDTAENVKPQMDRYKSEGFPKDYGLVQSNIIVRLHNNQDCIKVMETWASELNKESHRDQLSFNYALWKNQDVKIKLLDKHIYNSEWFKWNTRHGKQQTKTVSRVHPSMNLRKKINTVAAKINNGTDKEQEKPKQVRRVVRKIITATETRDRIRSLRSRIHNIRQY